MIRINLLPAREAKRRIVLRNQIQLAVVALCLTLVGLAYAALVAELVNGALLFGLLRKRHMAPTIWRYGAGPVLAVGLGCACALLLLDSALWFRLLSVSVAIAAGLWVFGGIRRHDLRFLVAILSGSKVVGHSS